MVRRKFIGETTAKVVRLADIYRPHEYSGWRYEDVNTGPLKINGADRVTLKVILGATFPAPSDKRRLARVDLWIKGCSHIS